MDVKRLRVPDFAARKRAGEKIVMLTAYDATMARLLDRAGVDALLVGDSLGTVILGLDTTLPVTLDAVVHHTRAVSRGASRVSNPPRVGVEPIATRLRHSSWEQGRGL